MKKSRTKSLAPRARLAPDSPSCAAILSKLKSISWRFIDIEYCRIASRDPAASRDAEWNSGTTCLSASTSACRDIHFNQKPPGQICRPGNFVDQRERHPKISAFQCRASGSNNSDKRVLHDFGSLADFDPE